MSDTYLQELLEEKDLLDPKSFVHSIRLLEDGKNIFLLSIQLLAFLANLLSTKAMYSLAGA